MPSDPGNDFLFWLLIPVYTTNYISIPGDNCEELTLLWKWNDKFDLKKKYLDQDVIIIYYSYQLSKKSNQKCIYSASSAEDRLRYCLSCKIPFSTLHGHSDQDYILGRTALDK